MTHAHPKLNQSVANPSPLDYLQNTGFYRSEDRTPLIGKSNIPDEFRLHDAAGTGIFILGFNPHSEDWVTDVQLAVCENFFMAIDRQQLSVTITPSSGKPLVIEHETIDDFLNCSDSSRAAYHFYKATRSSKPKETTSAVSPLGKLDVFLDPSNGPSRTAYINKKGMLITSSSDLKINPVAPRRRVTWTDYTMVVMPQTNEGDLWVRSMESPAHDSIYPEQLPEPEEQQQASTVFRNVRRQLRAIIDNEMDAHHTEASHNLTELTRYLPENDDEEPAAHFLEVTRIEVQPSDTPFLDYYHYEESDSETTPENGDSSRGRGNIEQVESESEETKGWVRRAIPRIPVQNPRAIPVAVNQVCIRFTPTVDCNGPISLTIHPRGYEPTMEPAISIIEAQCLSPETVACSLLKNGAVRLVPETEERINVLLTTNEPIDQLSAFDLHVCAAE